MDTRKYSNYQEKRIANNLGGKKVSNSGATPFHKGDIITNNFLIEAKTQIEEKKSFTIKKEWIDKNKEEAFAMKKEYQAIAFNFGGEHNKQNFYIIDESLFRVLIDYIEEK